MRAARALLNAMVLPAGADQLPKAQRQPFSTLAAIVGGPEPVERTLRVLQAEEIVRPAASGSPEGAWQLDHDYLARAVLDEARQADLWGTALRDRFAIYRAAEGSPRKRWAALLPIAVQARLLWEKLRGRLRYGEAAGYARLSAAKPALLLASLVLVAGSAQALYQYSIVGAQAQAIVDRLDEERDEGKRAVLDLWMAPSEVRARAVSRLLNSPGRLRAAGTDWVKGAVALDTQTVRALATELRARLDTERDSDTRKALYSALGSVAAQLNEDGDEVNMELSPNLGDGLRGQAAAIWDCEDAGLAATSIPSVNLTP
jgi:hypothetical protein